MGMCRLWWRKLRLRDGKSRSRVRSSKPATSEMPYSRLSFRWRERLNLT
jgi:hypothetical protein